jgi:heat shock protein HslJ
VTDHLDQLPSAASPGPTGPTAADEVLSLARRRARRRAARVATAVLVVAAGTTLVISTPGPAGPRVEPLDASHVARPVDDVASERPDRDPDAAEAGTGTHPGELDPGSSHEPEQQDPAGRDAAPSPVEPEQLPEPGPVRDQDEAQREPEPDDRQQHWAWLADRDFQTRTYERDGQPSAMVDDTELRLRFFVDHDGEPAMTWHAGCNLHGATIARITQDRLRFEGMSGTSMGCDEGREEQDAWLLRFLDVGPRWQLDGDRLTLLAGNTRIELTEELTS